MALTGAPPSSPSPRKTASTSAREWRRSSVADELAAVDLDGVGRRGGRAAARAPSLELGRRRVAGHDTRELDGGRCAGARRRIWPPLPSAPTTRLGAAAIFLRRCHLPSPRRSLFFLRHRHLPSAVAALSSSPDQASSSPDLASGTSLGARRGLLGVVTLPVTERKRTLATREATEATRRRPPQRRVPPFSSCRTPRLKRSPCDQFWLCGWPTCRQIFGSLA